MAESARIERHLEECAACASRLRDIRASLDLIAAEMDRGRYDVAWRLAPYLDEIFAEIGLDRCDACLFQSVIEADLFRDHRLAFGDELRSRLLADADDCGARLLGGFRPVNLAARLDHLLLVMIKIEIEIGEDMVLDVPRDVAQAIEFRKIVPGMGALGDKARAGLDHRTLELSIG